ncbi:MAG: protein translocase subunit SecD [Roseburia sp.]
MKKGKAVGILVAILAALVGLIWYASHILSSTNAGGEMAIPLGLDLSGGVSITYQVLDEEPSLEDVEDTLYKLQRRVEGYSTEATVYQVGDNRIAVEIPGISDAGVILEELGNPGSLEFQLPDGTVFMTGDDVAEAQATRQKNEYGGQCYVVQLILTNEGTKKLAEATEKNVGECFSILYDGQVISRPQVQETISHGMAQISGRKNFEEAELLATQIRIGSLSLKLREVESSVVGAQLGGKAISSSVKAAAVGLAIVVVYMIVLYLVPGIAASIALCIYTSLVIVVLYLFDITLTLPGIAGIILGIGMAVDANIIVFVRIREEIAEGKPISVAMHVGFQKALSAILDGNITTLLATVVLMLLGTGTVKGFAYTLAVGIMLSMFTSLIVTRWILYALYALGLREARYYGSLKQRKTIDFLGRKRRFFFLSGAVIAVGLLAMIVHAGLGENILKFSLDFLGGTSTTADFGREYTMEEVENDVLPIVADAIHDNSIQANKEEGTTKITIKTRTLNQEERDVLIEELTQSFGVYEVTSQSISSTISREMRMDAIVAMVMSAVCMLVYIWIRFLDIRFGIAAIVALLHDVFVVITVYALLRLSVGNTFAASILTIIGYSINNTIVVFDRIRENRGGAAGRVDATRLAKICNKSITQTLSWSISTSFTTFVMVFVLFVFGVPSIREFCLSLMAGLIGGIYSSVCIATALWYTMKLHLGKKP